jgi:hypothetical protein
MLDLPKLLGLAGPSLAKDLEPLLTELSAQLTLAGNELIAQTRGIMEDTEANVAATCIKTLAEARALVQGTTITVDLMLGGGIPLKGTISMGATKAV